MKSFKAISCEFIFLCALSSPAFSLEEINPAHGIDANQNGVRDDVEKQILKRFTDPKQRAAAMRMAIALQTAITTDKSSPQEILNGFEKSLVGADCIQSAFADDAQKTLQFLTAATVNTEARRNSFTAYSRALRQTVPMDEVRRRTLPESALTCLD